MIWLLGFFLALGFLLLVKPLWLRLEWQPFLLHLSWMGLGIEQSQGQTQVLAWGFRFTLAPGKPKEPSLKVKPDRPKKAGKRLKKPSLALLTQIWALGLVQRVAKRLQLLLLGLIKAVRLHYFGLQLGQLGVYEAGVLGALFAVLPLDNRWDLQTNFLGEQQARAVISISLGRVLWELFKLLI